MSGMRWFRLLGLRLRLGLACGLAAALLLPGAAAGNSARSEPRFESIGDASQIPDGVVTGTRAACCG